MLSRSSKTDDKEKWLSLGDVFMKVLVAIDDSKYSEAVIEELAARPWWGDTGFLVLHVVAVPNGEYWQDWGLRVDSQLKERLWKDGEKLVTESVAKLKKGIGQELAFEGKVVEGHTCDSIAEMAADWDADLIVIGSQGRTGLDKFLLGSVAEGVLLRAPCSVEIIKTGKKSKIGGTKTKQKKAVLAY